MTRKDEARNETGDSHSGVLALGFQCSSTYDGVPFQGGSYSKQHSENQIVKKETLF